MLRGNWSSRMMRLRRRRGPSPQLASSPRSAASTRAPNSLRMVASHARARSVDSSLPNHIFMRSSSASRVIGKLPNQNSRTRRASSSCAGAMASSALLALGNVGFEELLKLLRGFARGADELCLILLDRILLTEGSLIVLPELAYRGARYRGRIAESDQRLLGKLQTRAVGFAHDVVDLLIHEREGVLAVAGARQNLEAWKIGAHDLCRAQGGVRIVDREHEKIG